MYVCDVNNKSSVGDCERGNPSLNTAGQNFSVENFGILQSFTSCVLLFELCETKFEHNFREKKV